jgi:hypothetical protein
MLWKLLNLILVQHSSLNIIEVPCDQEITSTRNNTRFTNIISIVELSSSEIQILNVVLYSILRSDRKLFRYWFLFSHCNFKSSFATINSCWNNKQVCLAGCKNPSSVKTHINWFNGLSKSLKQSLSLLSNLLIQSNISIHASKSKPSLHSSRDSSESRVSFVVLFIHNAFIRSYSRIKLINSFTIYTNQCSTNILLAILGFVYNLTQY